MNEQQQQSFFHSIFNLGVSWITVGEETGLEDEMDEWEESPAITMSTSALLETLPHFHAPVNSLDINNFALTRQSDVQAVSNIILAKCETLLCLQLEGIKCPVDDYTKQESEEPNGFLYPLLHAAVGFEHFR
jgi:hypothetical protein